MDYVYIEYPKCLYNQDGTTMNVDNREEEDAAHEMGWATAEEYHGWLKHKEFAGPLTPLITDSGLMVITAPVPADGNNTQPGSDEIPGAGGDPS